MSPTKKFLLTLAVVSFVVWLGGNMLLGPPGLSDAYLAQYHDEHEHYLAVIKSKAYKLWEQRPHLYAPDAADAPPHFAENLAFVERYEANPAFQAEQRRIARYGTFFDFFNAALLVALFLWAARKPLLNFLDRQIAQLREQVEASEQARQAAKTRLDEADNRIAGLAQEQEAIARDAEARVQHEMEELAAANARSIEIMEKELQDRLAQEELRRRLQVRTELVDAALESVRLRLEQQMPPEAHARLVDEFVANLEQRSA